MMSLSSASASETSPSEAGELILEGSEEAQVVEDEVDLLRGRMSVLRRALIIPFLALPFEYGDVLASAVEEAETPAAAELELEEEMELVEVTSLVIRFEDIFCADVEGLTNLCLFTKSTIAFGVKK